MNPLPLGNWTPRLLVITLAAAGMAYGQAGQKTNNEERVQLGLEFRTRAETRTGEDFTRGQNDSFRLTRLRVEATIRATPWLRVFLQAQDSQALGLEQHPDPPGLEDSLDLRQAYVQFSDRAGRGGLIAGRQELNFGDQRLIGALDWGNTARSFDVVRAFYGRGGYRLDAFAASVVVIEDGAFNKRRDGSNVHGLYGTSAAWIPKGNVEAYLFWRTAERVRGERRLGEADTYTGGSYWHGTLPAGWDYRLQGAVQWGRFAGDTVRAHALHAQVGYMPPATLTSPRLLLEYNHASGDRNPNDGVHGTFDQLFPTNHNKYGIADHFGYRNLRNLRAGVAFQPLSRLSLQVDLHSFWLASRRDALYSAAGQPVARVAQGAIHSHIGTELDVDARVELGSILSVTAGYARLFPGSFLKEATGGAPSTFLYGAFVVRF